MRQANSMSQDLHDSVLDLKDEVRVLRDALDELRDELTYAVRNGRLCMSFERIEDLEFPVSDDSNVAEELSETTRQKRQPSSGFLFETK